MQPDDDNKITFVLAVNREILAAPLAVKTSVPPARMIHASTLTSGRWVRMRKTWQRRKSAVTLRTCGFMS